jgi:hypothetical protein
MVVSGRRSFVGSLLERAEQLKRERDEQALLAAAAERAMIAGEMHDIVSQSLTVMIAFAHGSVEMRRIDPQRATVFNAAGRPDRHYCPGRPTSNVASWRSGLKKRNLPAS